MENALTTLTISGIDCYEKDGVAYLKLETVARGLGFTQTQNKNGTEYTSIRWETVNRYLEDFGFPNKLGKDDFNPYKNVRVQKEGNREVKRDRKGA